VRQVLDSEYAGLFEALAQETGVPSTVIAVALTETMKALRRDGVETERIGDGQIRDLFRLIDRGGAAKEAIPEILTWLSKHEGATAEKALEDLGLAMISEEEMEAVVEAVIRENEDLVRGRGRAALGPLMGLAMKRVRGRAKAEAVSEALKRKLEEIAR